MKVRDKIDLEIFEEEDWEFETEDIDFIGEDLSSLYKETRIRRVIRYILMAIWWVISLIGIVIFGVVISLKVTQHTASNEDNINSLKTVEVKEDIVHKVDGEDVVSSDFIQISGIFSEYTYILSTRLNYASIDSLCKGGSDYVALEKSNKQKSKYNLDEYDCSSRAYRGIASKISLVRVNDIVYSDNKYYCYVSLAVPDVDSLFEYYLRYSYEMTQFLSIKGVSMVSVSEYINQTIDYLDFPTRIEEYVFTVIKDSDCSQGKKFLLESDSQITGVCKEVFDEAVTQITEISGSRLPVENLG